MSNETKDEKGKIMPNVKQNSSTPETENKSGHPVSNPVQPEINQPEYPAEERGGDKTWKKSPDSEEGESDHPHIHTPITATLETDNETEEFSEAGI